MKRVKIWMKRIQETQHWKRDLRDSNTLINVEVETIESEVHLNYPVDTREEETVRIKSRNQVPRSRRHQLKS